MEKPHKFPDSSQERYLNPRVQAAGVRAIDGYARVTRFANHVNDEIDEVTAPHGIPVTELHEEDSMVVAVAAAIDAAPAK